MDFSNQKEIQTIKDIVNKESSSNTIDLGPNVGVFTKVLAECSKHVYAFEPEPDNFKQLQENTKHLNNVSLYNVALSDHYNAHGILYKSLINNGMHRMYPSKLCEGGQVITNVVTITLDSIIMPFTLKEEERIDLIKMDVEGFEYFVILGMTELIKRDKPVIISEFHPDSIRESGADPKLLSEMMIGKFGYNYPKHCITGEILDSYEKLEKETNDPKGGINILWMDR